MKTIIEDYVSFETAKLLKEKGFDEPCLMCYTSDKKLGNYGHYNSYKNSDVFALTAPTLQMAMKWLREVHHIFLSIQQHIDMSYVWYAYVDGAAKGCDRESHNNTYEEACEAAIKYCLENLI